MVVNVAMEVIDLVERRYNGTQFGGASVERSSIVLIFCSMRSSHSSRTMAAVWCRTHLLIDDGQSHLHFGLQSLPSFSQVQRPSRQSPTHTLAQPSYGFNLDGEADTDTGV